MSIAQTEPPETASQRLRGHLGPGATHCLVPAGDLAEVLDDLDALLSPAPRSAAGRPPYGWRSGRGQLVPALDELRQLRIASRLRDGGAGWAAVAESMTEAGLFAREGRPWSSHGIARAVDRAKPGRPAQ